MVAMLWCDLTIADRLDRLSAFGRPMEFSEAWRGSDWEGAQPHVAILIYQDEIRWLGRALGGRRITSRDRIVNCFDIQEIDPIAINHLRGALPPRYWSVVERRGILPPATGNAVVRALVQLRPYVANDLRWLARDRDIRLPPGKRGEVLSQERDGTGLILSVAGYDRGVLRSWSEPPAEVPFLGGIPDERPALEDHLINHDVERFSNWLPASTESVAWRAFTDGQSRLFVMNANRTAVENTLGVDVVYFNERRSSFVLVQYKKMSREQLKADGSRTLGYRPDSKLKGELARMEKVDRLCSGTSGEFRLLRSACWMKLCEPSGIVKDPSALVRGMYFAREHFLDLMDTSKGPRGGIRLTYDNVQRHLNNTQFIELVRDGWIGTSGSGSDQVQNLIRQSIQTGHAVVFGVRSVNEDRSRGSGIYAPAN
ncbi:hypothetical protein ODJ79_44980 [Actinoplanes sp. KI2]|uniref:hypothetical protein n=1 Tax=Actinoplanes sp. KI2 TaxID=2983315 RepID=UPI0021D5C8DA|nr:hypothetical protein [Actinoplanes sp. KI2]MCU7730914.1 hypothetical protein [Actinoplanes sp. KI2]